jgi:hypothetical protein
LNPEMKEFLSLPFRPERLTIQQAAWLLGFGEHEISLLIARGLLKPLGHPAHNGQKFFLAATLEDLRRDEKWFSKATDAVTEYWRQKNSRKGSPATDRHGSSSGSGNARELTRSLH